MKSYSLLTLLCLLVAGAGPLKGQVVQTSAAGAGDRFQKLDQDKNGSLSEEEFLRASGVEDPLTPEQLRQRFRVFDADHNGEISFEEFMTIPGVVTRAERTQVSDPLAVSSRHVVDEFLVKLVVPVPAAELVPSWSVLPETIPREAAVWDLNGDGQVDQEEARRGLEMAYGLRRPDGLPARHANGFIFNGSYFQHLDSNGDRVLSRAELVEGYHLGREAALELLERADQNGDQQLDFTEIDQADLFLTDAPKEFLKWDRDFNGRISANELERGAAWQRHLAPQMLPAFDRDQDGSLSLDEFLSSPLSNPLVNWTSQRRDRNGNGTLELKEFAGTLDLCGSGLSATYFQQLDRNSDWHLDLREFSFVVDPGKLSAAQLAALYDRNADQRIDMLELFSQPGRQLLQSADQLLIPQHAELYHEVDRDRNGTLSVEELIAAPELLLISDTEARLRRDLLPRFQKLDQNQDHQLDEEEWKSFSGSASDAERKQAFRLADMNRSGAVAFEEFCSAPAIQDVTLRPWVQDPIHEEQRRILTAIEKDWPREESSLSAFDLTRRIVQHTAAFSEADLSGWDLNRDGAFDRSEVQTGLQRYFAIRSPSGEWLRRPSGQVFNWRTVKDADLNKDQMLGREEFFIRYWKRGAEADQAFRSADFNGDDRLSLSELLRSQLFWIDTQQEFLRFDNDLDGELSPQELREQSRPHEKRIAQLIFPVFDLDGNGSLSFVEFRLTPLANPIHDYDTRRWDLDDDGKLSLLEFHRDAQGSRWGIGLSELFFRKLDQDRNRSLSFAEMKSSANLKRLPADAVFERLDVNGDGGLQLAELLSREQPRNQSAWAKRNSEQRCMEIEEAFLVADVDRNHSLSLQEFSSGTSSIRDVVLGVTIRPARTKESVAGDHSSSGSRWRMISFVAANVCLFLGVGFWQLRRYRQS